MTGCKREERLQTRDKGRLILSNYRLMWINSMNENDCICLNLSQIESIKGIVD